MYLTRSILRLLLALAVGVVPMLCCCGSAAAEERAEVVTETVDDAHACCASPDAEVPAVPASDRSHDCGCDGQFQAMPDGLAHAKAVLPLPAELPCLHRAPLSWPLTVVLTEQTDFASMSPASEPSALPAAPTLRTLSVLLLT